MENLSKIYGMVGYFGVTLRQICVIRVTLEAYVSHFDVEKPKMAHARAICGGLVGPKSGNVGFSLVLPLLFEGSRAPGVF